MLKGFRQRIKKGYHNLKLPFLKQDPSVGRAQPTPQGVMIVPYMSYGSQTCLQLQGRVFKAFKLGESSVEDSTWGNLANMLRRFTATKLKGARLHATVSTKTYLIETDQNGYFNWSLDLEQPLDPQHHVENVTLQFLDAPSIPDSWTAPSITAKVMIPSANAQYGVISDIDDTVLRSDVVDTLKLLRNTFLKNAHTRLPFKGVAAFYRALQEGTTAEKNPIFYVSSSPWNLYDFLMDFFGIRGVPEGPLFLRDVGLSPKHFSKAATTRHKHSTIQALLDFYQNLPFILIGDSSEHDADIYLDIAQNNPGRIKAIYIRDVASNLRLNRSILDAPQKAEELGVDLLLARDTVAVAEHAVRQGYIRPEAMRDIRSERKADQRNTSLFERPVNIL